METSLYKRTGIYAIKNIITNEAYIGQTEMNFGDRRDSHFSLLRNGKHGNPPLQAAWNKYGEDNFTFVVLHDFDNLDDPDELEKKYIQEYMDAGLAYNIVEGGKSVGLKGLHLSDETKRKIGEKNRINMTGRHASKETKDKMSKSQKKRLAEMPEKQKQEMRRKQAESSRGRKLTKEQKNVIIERERSCSNAATHTPEQIKYIRHLYDDEGKTTSEIAKLVGETTYYIWQIVTRRRWKYI